MASRVVLPSRCFAVGLWVDAVFVVVICTNRSVQKLRPVPHRVKSIKRVCREQMICPLFVASDLSALPALTGQSVVREGDDALSAGGPGAGHDDSRGGVTRH